MFCLFVDVDEVRMRVRQVCCKWETLKGALFFCLDIAPRDPLQRATHSLSTQYSAEPQNALEGIEQQSGRNAWFVLYWLVQGHSSLETAPPYRRFVPV